MRHPLRLLALGAVVVWGGMLASAPAEQVAPATRTATTTAPARFLAAGTVDPMILLAPAPANDSAESKAELELVLSVQKGRTEAEVARAKAENKLRMGAFTEVVGPWFTAENMPKLDALLVRLEPECKAYSNTAKEYFKRPRPPVLDSRVQPVLEEKAGSYPSGHATRGMVYALVLSELMPEMKEKLVARGLEIGWDRVIAGVHYPSDLVAGRVLGQALARALLENAEFKVELEAVRGELKAAREKAGAATQAAGGK